MGFRGLLPASELTAFYNVSTQLLTLFAEGTTQKNTYGINFHRDPWLGGYKFSLYGWTGPLTGKRQEYKHDQDLGMVLEPIPKDIIVVTSNHPNGTPVPLNIGGFEDTSEKPINGAVKTAAVIETGLSSTEGKPVTFLTAPGQEKISVLFKEAFSIKHAAAVPSMGSIKLHYDPRYLVITDAGIQDNQIVWTFNSLETGDTQVILTVSGGIATFIMTMTYNVRIFVLDSVPLPFGNIEPELGAEAGRPSPMLDFLGRVGIARTIVARSYPDAKLYMAVATGDARTGSSSPIDLTQMGVYFQSEKDGGILITSSGNVTFREPHKSDLPFGSVPFIMPGMAAQEADKILKAEGHTKSYDNLTLRQPSGAGSKAPRYEFRMKDGSLWFVSTATKTITTE